jgi:hypothetical protein
VWELPNHLAHTLFTCDFGFYWLITLRCNNFKSWGDAHAHVVWHSWCRLAWLKYPQNELVIERAITGRERVCVANHVLTTKIPSALLVASTWLQHTWCPRFRCGTFGYGTTTSPHMRDRIWVWKFPCECTLVHPRFPNAYDMQCILQWHLFLIRKGCEKDKRMAQDWRIGLIMIGRKFLDEFDTHHRTLIWSQPA